MGQIWVIFNALRPFREHNIQSWGKLQRNLLCFEIVPAAEKNVTVASHNFEYGKIVKKNILQS